MLLLRLAIAVALYGALGACDRSALEDDASAPDDAAVLPVEVGDWFLCLDPACTELETTGLRLAADRDLHHLTAAEPHSDEPAPFREGDPYCVTEPFGRYAFAADVLTLTLHDGGLQVETNLVIEDGGVFAHDGAMHKVQPNATGRWVDKRCVR